MKSVFFAIALSGALFQTAGAQAPVPFDKTVRNYAYIGKAGLNAAPTPTRLYKTADPSLSGGGFDLANSIAVTYTSGTQPAQSLNAAGISSADGYMYSMEYLYNGPFGNVGSLYRVGANGVAEMAGTIPPPAASDAGVPSMPYSFINSASATIDAAGNYWFTAYGFTNPNPNPANVHVFLGMIPNPAAESGTAPIVPQYYHLDITDPVLQVGYFNFMTSALAHITWPSGFDQSRIANADGGFQDMDIRLTDGKLYSYIAFPNAPTTGPSPYPEPPLSSHLVRLDPSVVPGYDYKVSVINSTPAATAPNREENGAWFDAAGNYYVMFTNGDYALVNLADGSLSNIAGTGLPMTTDSNLRGDLATNVPVIPTPVKLLAFTGTSAQNTVHLNWNIADWNELSSIAVERSADGRKFAEIASIKPAGQEQDYTDRTPIATGYYRLRMNTASGASIYSFTIRFADGKASAATTAYPNPATAAISILSGSNKLNVQLRDLNGRVIMAGTYSTENGRVTIPLAGAAPGLFLLTVTDATSGTTLLHKTMMKQ